MSYQSFTRCIPCRHWGEGEQCFHHLYTRGAHPELSEEKWNLISVCLKCHNKFHNHGTAYMAAKHPAVYFWLVKNGWEKCPTFNDWFNPLANREGLPVFPTYEQAS